MALPTHLVVIDGNTSEPLVIDEDTAISDVITAVMNSGTDMSKIKVYDLNERTLKIAKVELV